MINVLKMGFVQASPEGMGSSKKKMPSWAGRHNKSHGMIRLSTFLYIRQQQHQNQQAQRLEEAAFWSMTGKRWLNFIISIIKMSASEHK